MKNKIKKNKVSLTIGLIMTANFLVKFFGLLRDVLMAKYYGTTLYTDAYIIANNIPSILFAALGASIATTFIPMYSNICNKENEDSANTFTIHLMEIILFICLILTIIGEVFTKQVVFIFASGFEGETLSITIKFVKILFPSIFGMALFDLFGSYLQQHGKFSALAVVPIIGNTAIIFSLILSNLFDNIYLFIWGTLLGLTAQVFFYLPWILKAGLFECTWGEFKRDTYIRELIPLLFPVFIGAAVNEINSIVDKTLVSGLEIGSVAALSYSYKIINLVIGVIAASIMTVQYPKLARLAVDNNESSFRSKGESTISAMFAIVFPISILVIVFREEIIRILFQRGSFDELSVSRTALTLKYYGIGLSAMGIREVLIRLFYCLQDTKTPMINGIIGAFTNIVLDVILIQIVGLKGAPLATSISAITSVIILILVLNKRQIIHISAVLISCSRSLLAGTIFLLCLLLQMKLLRRYMDFSILYLACSAASVLLVTALYIFIQYKTGNIIFTGVNKYITKN